MIELSRFHGPVAVTIAYFVLWYAFLLGLQSRTKHRLKARYANEGKVFDRFFGQDPEMLAVDRTVSNMHEQMGPFLVSLWLYSIFVSPGLATWLGAAYVALRALYPLMLGKRLANINTKRVAFVTFPSYAIIFAMLGGTAWSVLAR